MNEDRAPVAPVAIGGPTGIGKTTLVNGLIEQWPSRYARPKTFTSRAARPGETEFAFVTKREMIQLYERGQLVSLDEAYGNFYGLSRLDIQRLLGLTIIPVKEVHPKNFPLLRSAFPRCVTLVLLPSGPLPWRTPRFPEDEARLRDDSERFRQLDPGSFDKVFEVTPATKPHELRSLVHDFLCEHFA